MGTGWRRAFCSSISRDRESATAEKHKSSCSPSSHQINRSKLGGFVSPRLQCNPGSSPSLLCRTTTVTSPTYSVHDTPRPQCKTTSVTTSSGGVAAAASAASTSLRFSKTSNPSSPRSPLRFSHFSLLKASLRLSRSSCGICLQSMKTRQGTAIFTAECSHAFHFPCIAAHVKKHSNLVCPVCNTNWKEVPLLAIHKNPVQETEQDKEEKSNETEPPCSVRDLKMKKDDQQQFKPSDPRVYDDDEPLFVPIPEANEDEIEEFQGFFVNPNSYSTIKRTANDGSANGRDLSNVDVKLLPEAAVVSVCRSHETYVVALKLKAPRLAERVDPSRRAPIDLVTVLDVSGSMSGAKLYMLKRAMRLVISSLGSSDRLSIVAFSAFSKRLLPLKRMTAQGQRSARRIIDRLVCSQGNCVGDALRKAAKVLEDRRERNSVASIMLLSDGQEERVSPKAKSADRRFTYSKLTTTRFAHLEIPVRAFGFHESAEDAFAKCVGGLLSVVMQDLQLQIGISSSSSSSSRSVPAEIVAVYSCGGGPPTALGSGTVRLGDLYAEEERDFLVELKVPVTAVGAHQVMSLKSCYRDPSCKELVYGKEQALVVPMPQAIRLSEPKIERLKNLFVTTKAISEARRFIEHNDLSSAHRMLSSSRALLMQSSSISADECLRGLEAELAELHWRKQLQREHDNQNQRRKSSDENEEPLTPTSAWRAAERLAKVAIMRKSLNRVGDLHGFENARF